MRRVPRVRHKCASAIVFGLSFGILDLVGAPLTDRFTHNPRFALPAALKQILLGQRPAANCLRSKPFFSGLDTLPGGGGGGGCLPFWKFWVPSGESPPPPPRWG